MGAGGEAARGPGGARVAGAGASGGDICGTMMRAGGAAVGAPRLLRLASWNCADGFQRKAGHLARLGADVLCVQEVRRAAFEAVAPGYAAAHYTPSDTARGIASLIRPRWPVRVMPFAGPERCYHWLRLEVHGAEIDLLACWVKPAEDYARPARRAIARFLDQARAAHRVVLGDLNISAFFDRTRRTGRFADIAAVMAEHGLRSLYHAHTGERFGDERRETHRLACSVQRRFHLDYIWASEGLALADLRLGRPDPWFRQRRSDHLPMTATLVLPDGAA
jgi:exonuclease III